MLIWKSAEMICHASEMTVDDNNDWNATWDISDDIVADEAEI